MSDQEHPLLSADCENVLANYDLYAKRDGSAVSIRDCDGIHLFTVSREINARDLANFILFGQREFRRGIATGKEAMATLLRDILGAAPQPKDSSL